MGCIALVRCVLVLRCVSAGVVWCGIRMQAEAQLTTYLFSYLMGCIALVRCVMVLRCGLAGVVWFPDAG